MANQSISAWTILPFNTLEELNLFKHEGWAQLTQAGQNPDKGTLESKDPLNLAGRDIHLEFEYISWGGNGGQGAVIYLFDAAVPGAGTGSTGGAGLGYVKMTGAYIGIGLDEAGNFTVMQTKDMAEGAKDSASAVGSVVTVRGSQARGYAFDWAFPLPSAVPLAYKAAQYATRQQVIDAGGLRYVALHLEANKNRLGYTVYLRITGRAGTLTRAFDYPYSAPASMKLGIAATNGGDRSSNHELRNVKAALLDPALGPSVNPALDNLIENAPASIEVSKQIFAYPFLTDGDRVHRDWDGSGAWGDQLDHLIVTYKIDLSDKGGIEMNTLVIYSRQDDGAQQDPSDSTTFTQYGAISFGVYGEVGNQTGTPLTLDMIFGNDLAKRTLTFPRGRFTEILIPVLERAGTGACLVQVEAYNL